MKRLLSLLLAVITAVGFTACSPAAPANEEESTAADSSSASEDTTEGIPDNLPEKDYEGRDYVVWCDVNDYYNFYESEQSGEVISDAVYKRNSVVEERFNVNLVYDFGSDHEWRDASLMSDSILAGDSAYDLISGVTLHMAVQLVGGCFTRLDKLEYLDLTAPWWAQHTNSEIEINGRLYMASGFYDMPTVTRAQITFFSTELADKYSLGNMYDLVYDGKWTIDKMIELGKTVGADLDGNGIYDETDQYGVSSQWDVMGILITTGGYTYTTKNDDGTVSLTGYNDYLIQTSEKLYKLLYESDYYYSGYTYKGDHNYENMESVFTDNRSLFLINGIYYAQETSFRDMGTYGILPTPKLTDDQEEYGTFSSAFVSAIPIDAKDVEFSSIILEAMEAESYKTVLPAYYDIALSQKYLNDPDSEKMLDIIFGNTYCDFTYIYAMVIGDTALPFSVGIIENYTSWFESKQGEYTEAINDLVAEVNALPGN